MVQKLIQELIEHLKRKDSLLTPAEEATGIVNFLGITEVGLKCKYPHSVEEEACADCHPIFRIKALENSD